MNNDKAIRELTNCLAYLAINQACCEEIHLEGYECIFCQTIRALKKYGHKDIIDKPGKLKDRLNNWKPWARR